MKKKKKTGFSFDIQSVHILIDKFFNYIFTFKVMLLVQCKCGFTEPHVGIFKTAFGD